MRTPYRDAPASAARLTWIPLGLMAACAATVMRARILAKVDQAVRRLEPQMVEWRIAGELGADLAIACGLFLAAALAARLLVGRHLALTAVALIGLVGVAYLTIVGGPWAADFHRLDLVAAGRPVREAVLAAAALAVSLPLLAATVYAGRGGRVARLLGPRALVGAALLVPVTHFGYRLLMAGSAPTMLVREVCRDLLAGEPSWTVTREHPQAPPSAGILTPAIDYQTDSADLSALVMPPPCELHFVIGPEDGEVTLRAAAGVGSSVRDGVTVFGFEMTRNGETVFRTVIPGGGDVPHEERVWHRVARDFSPGDELGLRTWVEGVSDEQTAESAPVHIGFGQLVLERRERRERQPSSAEMPNILLVVQDTLRSDRLSCYGYEKLTSPHLDALAARGLRYSQAYATSSWTWPATASILTGLEPEAHGVTNDDSCYLSSRNETVAEALQRRGYTTVAFSANPLIVPQRNFDQGFERFFYKRNRPFRKSDDVIPEVLNWLEVHAGTRFFLYLHLVDSHAPHLPRKKDLARLGGRPPPEYAGDSELFEYQELLRSGAPGASGPLRGDVLPAGYLQWWNDAYDACTATGDHYLGRLVRRLDHLGIADETIIVFTSDHGEEWMDHGHLMHGHNVHRELVQVPLVLAGPGIPQGVVDTPVSNRHLAPTLARLGGADLGLQGWVFLCDPGLEEEPLTFSTHHGWWNGRQRQPIYGIRDGRFVLHLAPEGADWGVPKRAAPSEGQWRLYDIEADPGETREVTADHPAVAERLRHELLLQLERALARQPDSRFGAGAETLDMLRQFGYAGGEDAEDD